MFVRNKEMIWKEGFLYSYETPEKRFLGRVKYLILKQALYV